MYNVNWFLFRFSNYRLNSRKYVGSCYTVSARKACYNIGLFDILCAHSRNVTNCYSVNWCWIGIDGSSFGCSYCSICTVIGMFIVQSLLCLYYQFEYKKKCCIWFTELYLPTVASFTIRRSFIFCRFTCSCAAWDFRRKIAWYGIIRFIEVYWRWH